MSCSPTALVHYEVSRCYAETVLLPELRPEEDPDDARQGGMFHLLQGAAKGCTLAMIILARWGGGGRGGGWGRGRADARQGGLFHM
jgi:hypothetical protein